MALGDILATLNPMDYVVGMEKGLKLGQQRGITEQATALGELQGIKTAEYGGTAETERRAAETALGTTTAKLGDFLKNMELEVGRMNEGPMKDTLSSQIGRMRAEQQTYQQRAEGALRREPGLQAQYDQQAQLNARLFPQILERQEAKFNLDGVIAQANAGNEQAKIRLNNATMGADNLVRSIMGDPANQQIARDPYAVTELALQRVTDPDQRAYLVAQQDRIAKAKLAENINSAAGLAMWLPRAQPNMRAEPVPGDQTRVKIITRNVTERVDPATGQRTQAQQDDEEIITLDVNNDAYGRTQQLFAGWTGQKVPFIQPNLRDVRPTAQSPTAVATGFQTARPGQPATTNAGQAPPNMGPPAPARTAAPDPLQAQNSELDSMMQRIVAAPQAGPEGARRWQETLGAIRQLRDRGQPINPSVMSQLRQLIDRAAPPVAQAGQNPLTQLGQAIGQALPVPQPQPAEQTIQQLLTPPARQTVQGQITR